MSTNPSLEVKARKEPLCNSAAFSFDVSVSPVEKERCNSKLNEILQLSAITPLFPVLVPLRSMTSFGLASSFVMFAI